MSTTIKARPAFADYIDVLKPRETSLLVFIGLCSALIAASMIHDAFPVRDFVLAVIAILLGSAGANGLTNYLDRDTDSRMRRTCNRALAAKRIFPPGKVLSLIIILLIAGLVLAWILSPICFIIGLIGVISSAIFRKTIACTFLGIIAGSSPVLIGWYAITKQPSFDLLPFFYFLMIALWTPLHVWTLMISNRQDYENAGLHYFPLSWKDSKVIILLALLSIALSGISVGIHFITDIFGWLYIIIAGLLGVIMVGASMKLLLSPTSLNAWRVYKLSAFPYLGVIFTIMALDAWLI